MSRLIVISNRVSAATGGTAGAQGGLSVALTSALRESGVGSPGTELEFAL